MKTVIDAVKYYGGDKFINGKHEAHHTHIVSSVGTNSFYSAYASDIGGDSAVCTITQYNNMVLVLEANFGESTAEDYFTWFALIDRSRPKPTFTTAMCEAKILPEVGMECIGKITLRGSTKFVWHKVVVLFVFDKECAVKSCQHTTLHYCDDFKPIEPPKTDKQKAIDDLQSEIYANCNKEVLDAVLSFAYDKWVGES